jgi:hypothetical protein
MKNQILKVLDVLDEEQQADLLEFFDWYGYHEGSTIAPYPGEPDRTYHGDATEHPYIYRVIRHYRETRDIFTVPIEDIPLLMATTKHEQLRSVLSTRLKIGV